MGIPIDPELAENYHAIVDNPADPRSWADIADMADRQASPGLAAYAREQAAAGGSNITPAAAVPSYKNTRSKGIGKDIDGVGEPPVSFDKTTPGTRFPDLKPGDVTPTSVDPTGTTGRRAKDVSQNPSTAAPRVQADPTEPLSDKPAAASETVKPPQTTQQAAQAYNTEPPAGR
jgi:hypothetical protein